jgi:hypothetical protein
MAVLDELNTTRQARRGQGTHPEVVAGPPLPVAAWGDDLEQVDRPTTFPIREVFRKLAVQKESRIEEGHLMADLVHMLIAIPPKYAVSQVTGYIKARVSFAWPGCTGSASVTFSGSALLLQVVHQLKPPAKPGATYFNDQQIAK